MVWATFTISSTCLAFAVPSDMYTAVSSWLLCWYRVEFACWTSCRTSICCLHYRSKAKHVTGRYGTREAAEPHISWNSGQHPMLEDSTISVKVNLSVYLECCRGLHKSWLVTVACTHAEFVFHTADHFDSLHRASCSPPQRAVPCMRAVLPMIMTCLHACAWE